jgi:hypothetical protein
MHIMKCTSRGKSGAQHTLHGMHGAHRLALSTRQISTDKSKRTNHATLINRTNQRRESDRGNQLSGSGFRFGLDYRHGVFREEGIGDYILLSMMDAL